MRSLLLGEPDSEGGSKTEGSSALALRRRLGLIPSSVPSQLSLLNLLESHFAHLKKDIAEGETILCLLQRASCWPGVPCGARLDGPGEMESTHADPLEGFAESTVLARVSRWHASRLVTPAPGQGSSAPTRSPAR